MTELHTLALESPALVEAHDSATPEFFDYVDHVDRWFRFRGQPYAVLDPLVRGAVDAGEALGLRLALKIAESRRIIEALNEPVTVTLVNPVYKETGRLRPRAEHPHGEDSLRVKAAVLQSLEARNPHFEARIVVVDDECPDGSGLLAESILEDIGDERHRVLFLGEAIDRRDAALPAGLTHKDGPRRSVKGGSVLYGMRTVLDDTVAGRHVVVDNDADLSVHPEQVGLLVGAIADGSVAAVAGSRREADSVAVIGGSRNVRGRLYIQIWQHLLPELATRIRDTNRAFKAFDAHSLSRIIGGIETFTFPYQVELLQACVSHGIPLARRGIGYLDSEAASTQQGAAITETYLHQIHQIVSIARRYETIALDDALADFFHEMTEERWAQIEADPPTTILDLVP